MDWSSCGRWDDIHHIRHSQPLLFCYQSTTRMTFRRFDFDGTIINYSPKKRNLTNDVVKIIIIILLLRREGVRSQGGTGSFLDQQDRN
jgi:hypothetical protein